MRPGHLAFLQERLWASEVEKKQLWVEKRPTSFAFFFPLSNQLMERWVFCFGDESLTESSETVMMEDKFFVCRGLPGAVFF